ncbi:DNRLRE domain-containing protein [Streptomyces gardneri]|uniref:DNRLRE domain-containing protein n=1 Tax=Streptomyces gardneri TaxID=66892 RepID=UPI0033E66035
MAAKATSTETRGNASCSATQPDGWINANVTTMVQEWASAKAAKSHMGLRASDENITAQWKRVNSANAATNPPKLVVTYNYRPRTGTKQEAGPPYFSYSGAYVVNTATPTLRDTFLDPNGDKTQGAYQIFDSVTDTQVGAVLRSAFVPSGQPAPVTVPAGALANGKTYKFRSSPYDGTHYNLGWSEWKTFTVDTTAPSAPTGIASTDYPPNTWVKGAGQAGTFTVTPNGTDHNWLEWSLDGVTWTKVATGGATTAKALTVTPPKDGTHTLQVRQADKADNKSEAIGYAFHAGPGGFVQPADGERTARRLTLVAEAGRHQVRRGGLLLAPLRGRPLGPDPRRPRHLRRHTAHRPAGTDDRRKERRPRLERHRHGQPRRQRPDQGRPHRPRRRDGQHPAAQGHRGPQRLRRRLHRHRPRLGEPAHRRVHAVDHGRLRVRPLAGAYRVLPYARQGGQAGGPGADLRQGVGGRHRRGSGRPATPTSAGSPTPRSPSSTPRATRPTSPRTRPGPAGSPSRAPRSSPSRAG